MPTESEPKGDIVITESEIARFRAAWQKRRESSSQEDPNASFRMVCREIGIMKRKERQEMYVIFTKERRTMIIGRWQSARHRPHHTEQTEERHEAIHREFNPPGAA